MRQFFSIILLGIITIFSGHSPTIFPTNSLPMSPIPTQQITYTNNQLHSTASTISLDSLPLGDGKYITTGAKKGYIYLCNVGQGSGRADQNGSWISGSTWSLSKKPVVSGKTSWSNAIFSNIISGDTRTLSGNDLPVNTITGTFPIQASDPTYQYDKNPNKIIAHTFSNTLPVSPTYSQTPYCMGGEVGIMLNGVPLFNAFDADHRDAPAHELQDACQGHPQQSGEYHYHSLTSCIPDVHETTVIGFALDGFPITGPQVTTNKYLSTNDLDECHGIRSEIVLDGKKTTMYHYVMTEDFPYSVSCFRGKPVSLQVISNIQGGQVGAHPSSSLIQKNGIQNSQNIPQPPQAALTACVGKITNDSCGFSVPQGSVIGTCQTPPYQTNILCVPTNPPR